MTLAEFKKLLDATGYPVAYSHFEKETTLPFITYLTPSTSNLIADNRVYQKINNVDVELYTKQKDLAAEQKLESVLDQAEIPYDVTEIFIEDQKVYQRIYEITL